MPRAVAAVIHDVFANLLVGRSVFDIERHWRNMFATVNFFGFASAEMRAISTLYVALWDLLGQYKGQPIYNLLGGRSRDRIPIYDTCVSHAMTPLLDCDAWMEGRAAELSKELLATGVRAMKIWSWDQFGDLTHHAEFLQITPVRQGLASCYQHPRSAFSQPA